MRTTHILIVGTGAVGGFYGSRLQFPPDTAVSLVCRSNYNAVKKNGLVLKTRAFGDYHFKPHAVFANIKEAASSGIEYTYIVVTAKALPDVSDESKEMMPLVREQTSIVLIQNGVGVESPYRKRFPSVTIITAATVISAEQIEPGVIRQNRWTRISLGPYFGFQNVSDIKKLKERGEASSKRFTELLQRGGIQDAELHDEAELQLIRWHKIAINASMNPSAVLSGGLSNAQMTRDPELRIHLKGVMDEVLRTAPQVLGRAFPSHLATSDAILKSTDRNSQNDPKNSMALDWEAGKPLEIEVILGNPIRLAREKGIEMPRLQTLYSLIKSAQIQRDIQKKSKL